jgi:hypothetical protein
MFLGRTQDNQFFSFYLDDRAHLLSFSYKCLYHLIYRLLVGPSWQITHGCILLYWTSCIKPLSNPVMAGVCHLNYEKKECKQGCQWKSSCTSVLKQRYILYPAPSDCHPQLTVPFHPIQMQIHSSSAHDVQRMQIRGYDVFGIVFVFS